MSVHAHVIQNYGGLSLPERQRGGRLASWQLQRVRDRIEADLAGDLSIADLAGEAGLSTSYFNDAFKATTGVPPHRWILKRRVERAKTLLETTELGLAEVAVRCGFYDQGHMSRVFGRSEGLTPKAWRRLRRSR
jgi:AraC family transcriptional regulator